jgi:acetyl-CoA carboxylase carboxyltransferase component
MIRSYLGYFPSSAWSYPLESEDGLDVAPRLVPEMLDLVPRSGKLAYDMREVLEVIFDAGSVFEVQPAFGPSIITALCRLGGQPVAVVANQPMILAGSIDSDAADKAAHFISVADSFHLPIILLSDNPGVMPGTLSERQAILRSGARMYAAQAQATSPKFAVTFRKAYGFGALVMGKGPFDGQSGAFAFPGATGGAMGAAAMSRARNSDEDEATILRRLEIEASYNSAESFGADELIDPRETRNVLLTSLERALYRRQGVPEPVARIGITP